MKFFLSCVLFAMCLTIVGQTPVFEELEFEADSITTAYRPSGKNYVFLRSKRGTSGLNKTAVANAVASAEVNEIVLVYTELDGSAIEDREEANRERWENLLKTYPDFFQYSTIYKNHCQCNIRGDSVAFKKAQGFYVYINGQVPAIEEPKDPEPVKMAKTEERKPDIAKLSAVKIDISTPNITDAKIAPAEIPAAKKTQTEEKPVSEPVRKEPEAREQQQEESPAVETVVKENTRKRPTAVKARRAKDSKACRPACYEGGDEDLYAFFSQNITLSKKQKRKNKNLVAQVKLQLHHDGSIKNSIITCSNETFNQQVRDAIKSMRSWNCAVKAGVAVKSEVRMTLKFDRETKSIKPFDVIINPRQGPKCKCLSDAEIFGD